MKRQTYMLITISFLAMTLSCQKDTEILPEATKSGEGVFACMYDGKVINIEGAYAVYTLEENRPNISIIADYSSVSEPKTIYLRLSNTATGIYSLGGIDAAIGSSFNNDNGFGYQYRDFSGAIELTIFDTINHVISGKFNAGLYLNLPTAQQGQTEPIFKDIISIRSGRFDLPLYIHQYP